MNVCESERRSENWGRWRGEEGKKNEQKELHEIPNKFHWILIKTQEHGKAIPWHFNFFSHLFLIQQIIIYSNALSSLKILFSILRGFFLNKFSSN